MRKTKLAYDLVAQCVKLKQDGLCALQPYSTPTSGFCSPKRSTGMPDCSLMSATVAFLAITLPIGVYSILNLPLISAMHVFMKGYSAKMSASFV